jgi:hypothetical protein
MGSFTKDTLLFAERCGSLGMYSLIKPPYMCLYSEERRILGYGSGEK